MTAKFVAIPKVIADRLPECFGGITMPWRTVYLMPAHFDNESLRRHELVHIEQIERDGAIRFSVKYLWWLATKGYAANPYEVEAYAKAPIE